MSSSPEISSPSCSDSELTYWWLGRPPNETYIIYTYLEYVDVCQLVHVHAFICGIPSKKFHRCPFQILMDTNISSGDSKDHTTLLLTIL